MYRFTIYFGIMFFLTWLTLRASLSICFDQNVGGYLSQVDAAGSVEIAEERLEKAIEGINRANICNNYRDEDSYCNTSVLWDTQKDNVVFWRRNLQTILESLQAISPQDREDVTKSSIILASIRNSPAKYPDGISVFGANTPIFYMGWLSIFALIISIILICKLDD